MTETTTGWEPVEPIPGGHEYVWKCLSPLCGALVREVSADNFANRAAHDTAFHATDKDRPPVGTVYRDDEGNLYRITGYGVEFQALMDAETAEERASLPLTPQYGWWSAKGGASSGVSLDASAVEIYRPDPPATFGSGTPVQWTASRGDGDVVISGVIVPSAFFGDQSKWRRVQVEGTERIVEVLVERLRKADA